MLINHNPPVVPLETKLAASLIGEVNQTYLNLIYIQNKGVKDLWHHKILTPDSILAAMGTEAGKVFEYHARLTQFLLEMEAEAGITESKVIFPPADKAWMIHEDGTVTINDEVTP